MMFRTQGFSPLIKSKVAGTSTLVSLFAITVLFSGLLSNVRAGTPSDYPPYFHPHYTCGYTNLGWHYQTTLEAVGVGLIEDDHISFVTKEIRHRWLFIKWGTGDVRTRALLSVLLTAINTGQKISYNCDDDNRFVTSVYIGGLDSTDPTKVPKPPPEDF